LSNGENLEQSETGQEQSQDYFNGDEDPIIESEEQSDPTEYQQENINPYQNDAYFNQYQVN
jgi:hypothetical protein